jgi:hypothetical protein
MDAADTPNTFHPAARQIARMDSPVEPGSDDLY